MQYLPCWLGLIYFSWIIEGSCEGQFAAAKHCEFILMLWKLQIQNASAPWKTKSPLSKLVSVTRNVALQDMHRMSSSLHISKFDIDARLMACKQYLTWDESSLFLSIPSIKDGLNLSPDLYCVAVKLMDRKISRFRKADYLTFWYLYPGSLFHNN